MDRAGHHSVSAAPPPQLLNPCQPGRLCAAATSAAPAPALSSRAVGSLAVLPGCGFVAVLPAASLPPARSSPACLPLSSLPPPRSLVLFLCFNAFPDYNDVDSWEGTLRSIDRMCLCGGGLAGSATVSGRCGREASGQPRRCRASAVPLLSRTSSLL